MAQRRPEKAVLRVTGVTSALHKHLSHQYLATEYGWS